MKGKQVCPHCGKEINLKNLIDDFEYYKSYHKSFYTFLGRNKHKLDNQYQISGCKHCKNSFYNTNRKYLGIYTYIFILVLIVWLVISIRYYINSIFYFILMCMYTILYMLFCNYKIYFSNRNHQHYILCTKNKTIFNAKLISTLDRKHLNKEFFQNNILEIKTANTTCKVIINKILTDNEYSFTFIESDKEILKEILESNSTFDITNGMDILGKLEVTQTYGF